MSKYMSVVVLYLASASVLAGDSKGKWDVGVAVGAGMANFKETVNATVITSRGRYKFSYENSGPAGGLVFGYAQRHNKFVYGVSLGGYKDFYSATNNGIKHSKVGNLGDLDMKNDVKRKYTLEVSGRLGRLVNDSMELYGKLGLLRSAFQEQYRDDLGNNPRHTVKSWGGIAGVGLKRDYEVATVGLEYSYSYYEKTGTNLLYGPGLDSKNCSKFHPSYHNLYLTVSKKF
jgi:hypothetical protein